MSLAHLARRRVANATSVAVRPANTANEKRRGGPEVASIGTQGAIAYALLDVAEAIRETIPDSRLNKAVAVGDSLAEAIIEGNLELAREIAGRYQLERDGVEVDQVHGLLEPPDKQD